MRVSGVLYGVIALAVIIVFTAVGAYVLAPSLPSPEESPVPDIVTTEELTSRRTNILVDGDILKEIVAQNITSVDGVVTIEVDTLENPVIAEGNFVFQPTSVVDIVAANGVTVAAYVMRVQSSTAGNCDITANPQVAVGIDDGQYVLLVGSDDTKTVQFDDGTGLDLSASCTLGNHDTLPLVYIDDDSVWAQAGPCQDN